MQGHSLNTIFKDQDFLRNEPLYFEHMGNKAIRAGKWKLVSIKKGQWELYDMSLDQTELNDLSKAYPELKKELVKKYALWWKSVISGSF